jgi:hypothetical protein
MRSLVTCVVAFGFIGQLHDASPVMAADPQMAHMVFFKLKETTGQNKEALVDGCNKFLSDHDGVVYYSAGVIAEDKQRDVNDRDFDVALHVVFKNKAAHDKYQTHPRHLKFVEEYAEMWEGVRVFDSYLAVKQQDKKAKRIPLPDAAAYFAGMIRGKVVAKRDAGVVVAVAEVVRVWKPSRAENPKALVGKNVVVEAPQGRESAIARFVKTLKENDEVELDVAHRAGESLTILELTQKQRKKVQD